MRCSLCCIGAVDWYVRRAGSSQARYERVGCEQGNALRLITTHLPGGAYGQYKRQVAITAGCLWFVLELGRQKREVVVVERAAIECRLQCETCE